jgi:hypothetical protein
MKTRAAAWFDIRMPHTASTADCETPTQTCSLESNTSLRGKPVHPLFRDKTFYYNHNCNRETVLSHHHHQMAPRRAAADASPSPLRRLRLQADHPLRRHRISRRKVHTLSIREIRRIEILSEGYVSAAKEETDHEAETETETETRWERSTRGDARALWVEQLYRYEEL